MLVGVVALVLVNRNRAFLVGELVDPRARSAALQLLLAMTEIARVTHLRVEVVGPGQVNVVAELDLTGDDRESLVAVRLRDLEARLIALPAVVGAVLSLATPEEPSRA